MLPSQNELVPSLVVNKEDHGALVTITGAFCLTTSGLFFLARLSIRWPWGRLLGRDDMLTAATTLFAFLQTSFVLASISKGLGKIPERISSAALEKMLKLLYIGDFFYISVLFLTKAAVIAFLKRLATSKKHQKFLNMMNYACATAYLVSMLVIGIRTDIQHPWKLDPSTGEAMWYRWITIELLGMLLECGIFLFPCVLIHSLQMKRSAKLWVILGFASRLPLIVIAVIRLTTLSWTLRSPTFTFDFIQSEIATQAEMCYSVISATIPCLRIFVQSFNTGLLNANVLGNRSRDGTNRSVIKIGSDGKHNGSIAATGPRWEERQMGHSMELQSGLCRSTITNAVEHDDSRSLTSDGSENAIVVRRVIDVAEKTISR